jgi:hypothetical protein
VLYFSGIVPLGGQFIVDGGAGLDDRINIRTSTVDTTTGQAGQLLQAIQMRATCQEGRDDISLLTQYGAFQLVSFTSVDQGTNSAVVDIILSYSVINEGRLTAVAELVQRTSTLQGDTTLLSPPGVQLARGLTRSFQDISRLNLFAAAGFSFDTVLTVAGVGLLSGTACDDSILLLFPSAPRTWTSMVYFPLHSYSTKARCQCEITPETTSSVLHYSY